MRKVNFMQIVMELQNDVMAQHFDYWKEEEYQNRTGNWIGRDLVIIYSVNEIALCIDQHQPRRKTCECITWQ